MRDVVIVSGARTPLGSFQGSLSSISAPRLGAVAIKAAVERAGIDTELIDQLFMGCVVQAGQGQAPARQAGRYAGLPDAVPATTVHKVCGSGLQTVWMASQAIRSGDAEVVVAGGMENMSQAPYLIPKARGGFRLGHGEVKDALILDGLWDPYRDHHMGNAGELCAREFKFTREAQDAFAMESYRRALEAQKAGLFEAEIAPVSVPQRRGEPLIVEHDEEPGRGNLEKLPKLRPAFDREGTITAGNASTINDGASATVLMSREKADELGLKPLAKILSFGVHAQDPDWFTTAPADAIAKSLAAAELTADQIDVYEINEAFSVVALAVAKKLDLDLTKVNPRGGAVALGHPIGATGNRLVVTLLHTMRDTSARYGCASLCIGGGEALAMCIERL